MRCAFRKNTGTPCGHVEFVSRNRRAAGRRFLAMFYDLEDPRFSRHGPPCVLISVRQARPKNDISPERMRRIIPRSVEMRWCRAHRMLALHCGDPRGSLWPRVARAIAGRSGLRSVRFVQRACRVGAFESLRRGGYQWAAGWVSRAMCASRITCSSDGKLSGGRS